MRRFEKYKDAPGEMVRGVHSTLADQISIGGLRFPASGERLFHPENLASMLFLLHLILPCVRDVPQFPHRAVWWRWDRLN